VWWPAWGWCALVERHVEVALRLEAERSQGRHLIDLTSILFRYDRRVSVPAPARTRKGQATRDRLILRAREQAVANHGHLEIAQVAAAAGVAPSLINRYFGSRGGLLSALVDDFFDRLHAEVLDRHLDELGTWAQHEYVRLTHAVRFHYTDPFAVVLYTRLSREPEVARTETARIEAAIDAAARNIRRGQRKGEVPAEIDAPLAAAAIFGATQRVMVSALSRQPHPSPEHVTEVLWRQIAAAVQLNLADRAATLPPTAPAGSIG